MSGKRNSPPLSRERYSAAGGRERSVPIPRVGEKSLNMFLAAHAIGLGACWINQLGRENCEKVRDLLTEAGVPETDTVYACCALGYPDAPPAPRKPRSDSVRYYD